MLWLGGKKSNASMKFVRAVCDCLFALFAFHAQDMMMAFLPVLWYI